ncbi:hypothetical protein ACGFX8_14590 [Streptomyces sp. NPDC048362]|uniref:hypothetical protein n=1 Tax=Streptomyces sp. NPDC048362 TaxID=3365539 RepID=UPI0037206279
MSGSLRSVGRRKRAPRARNRKLPPGQAHRKPTAPAPPHQGSENQYAISFITAFRLAFEIPLPVLQRAQAWERFGFGRIHISDEEFSGLVSPWLTRV